MAMDSETGSGAGPQPDMPSASQPEGVPAEQAQAPEKQVVEIWTDGGCRPNPGPGGWGVLLRFKGVERELSGGEEATTNNRMELTAAAEALEALKRPCVVRLHTDSEYVRNGITRWHTGWVRRNWRNAAGDPVANMDLWRRLLDAAKQHDVSWHWVKGHSGVPENERVDELATQARKTMEEMLKTAG